MAKNDDKFISGLTARKYLKCSKVKFEELVGQGVIITYRDEEMRWRVSKDSVLDYFKKFQTSGGTRLIIENHYLEVINRVCAAKSSIKIMTGDFKRFKLKQTVGQGKNYNDGTPFIKYLMEKAEQGVSVQIICSSPSKPFEEEYKELYEQMKPRLFRIYFCIRNHAKVVIVDDKAAYIGSANVTQAGLGQGFLSPGNFETGILTDDPAVISQLNAHFAKILNGDYCNDCHRAINCVEY